MQFSAINEFNPIFPSGTIGNACEWLTGFIFKRGDSKVRYYLINTSRIPKFFKADGTLVEVKLKYVGRKKQYSLDRDGQLAVDIMGGTPPNIGNLWLVDNVELAMETLAEHDIFPYIDKASAKERAKQLGLVGFKYLPVTL